MDPKTASQAAMERVSAQSHEESFLGLEKLLLTLCIGTFWHYFSLLHPGAAKYCNIEELVETKDISP